MKNRKLLEALRVFGPASKRIPYWPQWSDIASKQYEAGKDQTRAGSLLVGAELNAELAKISSEGKIEEKHEPPRITKIDLAA